VQDPVTEAAMTTRQQTAIDDAVRDGTARSVAVIGLAGWY